LWRDALKRIGAAFLRVKRSRHPASMRVCKIVSANTAIVNGATYADFLFARPILERQGWHVLRPEAPTVA
jgi:hypothetical protein